MFPKNRSINVEWGGVIDVFLCVTIIKLFSINVTAVSIPFHRVASLARSPLPDYALETVPKVIQKSSYRRILRTLSLKIDPPVPLSGGVL